MRTKKENRAELRNVKLVMPLRQEEKENLRKSAESLGLTMSGLVRMALKDFLKRGEE